MLTETCKKVQKLNYTKTRKNAIVESTFKTRENAIVESRTRENAIVEYPRKNAIVEYLGYQIPVTHRAKGYTRFV